MLLHASCVALGDKAVLLIGPPGSGKSDVALRLVDGGAKLVSDDQTFLEIIDGALHASPPASIAGLIEVRYVGLLKMPYRKSAQVALYVELCESDKDSERLPGPDAVFLLDHSVPRLRLLGHAASTPAKIRAALSYEAVQEK